MCGIARETLLVGVTVLAGCERGATYGTSTRSASWSGSIGVRGIDDGTIASIKLWN